LHCGSIDNTIGTKLYLEIGKLDDRCRWTSCDWNVHNFS